MRKAYTVNLDTETWDMLCKLASALGVPRSRVLDMAVFKLHEQQDGRCKEHGNVCEPQRNIMLGPEEE